MQALIVAFFDFAAIIRFLAGMELLLILLWLGLGALSVALLLLAHTRWGQSRPLRKCFILSLLAHFLLAGYATTVKIVASRPTMPGEPVIHISIGETEDDYELFDIVENADKPKKENQYKPWQEFAHDVVVQPDAPLPEPQKPFPQYSASQDTLAPHGSKPALSAALAAGARLDRQPLEAAIARGAGKAAALSLPEKTSLRDPEPIEVPAPQRRDAPKTGITTASEVASSSPQSRQSEQVGIVSSLSTKPSPLPRLIQTRPKFELADALAAKIDDPSKAVHGRPVAIELNNTAKDSSLQPVNEQNKRDVNSPDNELAASDSANIEPGTKTTDDAASAILPLDNKSDASTTARVPCGDRNDEKPLPSIYRLRVSDDRSRLAVSNGASEETEAAVRAALKWLAENQNPDGRWDSRKHQAGREQHIAGRNRLNAGVRADTGVTGLAILAFMASGHTHNEGEYSENVHRGLEFLLTQQRRDGSLAGRATHYAAMYCHAMATFAMSEAYAMTRDERLEEPVRRAIAYSLHSQDAKGGGWRYMPGNPGDTSQFGWQLMALKSAELAGIAIPAESRQRMFRFLASVSRGRNQGLAAYRPDQPPSRSMTAEALACRQFLGTPPASATALEAGDYIIGELPGDGRVNLYYWYYATISLYQMQGEHWRRWNDALRTTLVESQLQSGPLGGSWDPNSVWGGYGGRVYSTALGALCLEVYYRYLPMYVEAANIGRKIR